MEGPRCVGHSARCSILTLRHLARCFILTQLPIRGAGSMVCRSFKIPVTGISMVNESVFLDDWLSAISEQYHYVNTGPHLALKTSLKIKFN